MFAEPTCNETLSVLHCLLILLYLTILLALLSLLGQEAPLSLRPVRFISLQKTSLVFPEVLHVILVGAVHVATVQEVGDLVHLLPVSKAAAELGGGQGPHEVHAPLTVLHEKGIVLWNLDWETLGVEDQLGDGPRPVRLAALDARGVRVAEPEYGGEVWS